MMVGMSVLAIWVAGHPAVHLTAGQAARRRPTGLGVLCCIAVVLLALAILIIYRSRRNRDSGG